MSMSPRLHLAALALAGTLATAAGQLTSQTPPAAAAFRTGDRIVLAVVGETAMSDTFTVRAGPAIDLPTVGAVSLLNVEPTQLEAYLTKEIGRFVRNPLVRAKYFVRVGMFGGIGKPNFYFFLPDALLSDAIALAGGPIVGSKIDKIKFERDGVKVLSSDSVRKALDHGSTLTDLGVRSGDRLTIPTTASSENVFRAIGYALAIPAGIWGVIQLFGGR